MIKKLKGFCTRNLELACLVCYLKIINIFFEKYCMHLKVNCPRNSKNGIEILEKVHFRSQILECPSIAWKCDIYVL